jgi:hypothetical protein
MILTCDSASPTSGEVNALSGSDINVKVKGKIKIKNQSQGQRARAPALHDYTARVSQRLSQSDDVRATAFMFDSFYFGVCS